MSKSDQDTAQTLASACADAMWKHDQCSKALGMNLVSVNPGEAVLELQVRPDMLNGHGICHGGIMFTLADSAFAFACNSYNQNCVAQHCSVSFLHAVEEGERLTAHATERSRIGRSGIYDVVVSAADGRVVAEFRGFSRTVKGTHVPDESADAAAE